MTAFWMALSMFSVFPSRFVWDENKRAEMLLWFPAVGVLIGAGWALVSWLLGFVSLPVLTAALMTALPWMLSGYMHLDGFIDCADAYLSRASKEKKLLILKDSRVGAFALIAMVLLCMFTFASFLEIKTEGLWKILLFIPAASRTLASAAVLNCIPMQGSSYEAFKNGNVSKTMRFLPFVLLLIEVITAFVFCGKNAAVLALELAASAAVIFRLIKEFGGMSGDISGCSIVISEFIAIVGLAVLGGLYV